MMASVILIFSLATLFMFFVSYCRSLMASSAKHVLSEEVRDVTGIQNSAEGQDFTRVLQLLQLCPGSSREFGGLSAVKFYYSFVTMVRGIVSMQSIREWAEREQAGCAYFAAVTLDRRIAFNREILAPSSEL